MRFWLVSPFALLSICGNTQSHTVQYVISVSVCFLPSHGTSSPSLLLLEPLYSVHIVYSCVQLCTRFDHICDFQLKKQLCQISPVVMTPIHYLQVYRIMSLCPIDDPLIVNVLLQLTVSYCTYTLFFFVTNSCF